MKTMWKRLRVHPIWSSVIIALVLGFLGVIGFWLITGVRLDNIKEILEFVFLLLVFSILLGIFVFYPAILTFINLIGLFVLPRNDEERKTGNVFELITLLLGSTFTLLFLSISNIRMDAEWTEQLHNAEVHQPIWSDATLTVMVLCILGVSGYLVLSQIKLDKLPPLIVVLCVSAMYLGILMCILWCIQTMGASDWLLSVFPINCIMIAIKTIRYKIGEWNQIKEEQTDVQRKDAYPEKPILNWLNNLMVTAELWPVLAFVLMWPLLGILLGILILFGQKPDAIIKAWTETADWRLSQQIAPQNAMYDEHYLCTVAAGGHENIVKPLRMGERHGHRVVVNRQLCIANAFEQILEERTPGFHRAVRHFYDTYGFPVSRLIRTKAAADVVYLLMKPLEWIFLVVIYLFDAKPENRIAVQYLPGKSHRLQERR